MEKTKHFATVEQRINVPSIKKGLVENVMYKATIRSETKNCLGSTGGTFKKKMVRCKSYKENGTEISKYVWKLENNNNGYKID